MSSFKYHKLADLTVRIKVGFVGLVNEFYCEPENGIPIIRTTDIDSIDFDKLKYVTNEFHVKNKKSQLKKGDLIIARHGENGNAIIYEHERCAQVLNAVIIEPDPKKISSELLKIFFDSPFVKKQISGSVKGSVQGVINTKHISDLLLNIGNHINYEFITKTITNFSRKIALNNKINTELEAMAKLIYNYWFVQFDFPDAKGKPYKSSGGKMVYSEALKREIPKGWKAVKLTEEVDVQYGYPFSTKMFNKGTMGNPVVRIRNILENSIDIYSTESVNDKYLIKKGDLLIGMDGNFHLNFWDRKGCYLNQRCVRIRKNKNSQASLLQVKFDIEPYIKSREKNVSRTTVGHLSAKDIDALHVLIPFSETVLSQRECFDNILRKIIINRNENQALSELRDWLLPMLMNGQVTVKGSSSQNKKKGKLKHGSTIL